MVNIIDYLLAYGEKVGYPGIILLMAVESSFFPMPSEVIIPPAAYLAQQGKMELYLVILAGTIGSMIGATFNYLLGRIIGQAVVYKLADHRFAKFFLINSTKLKKAEDFFLKSANATTFIGRLIPGIRHLISIPAGFFKMNFKNFIFYTFWGSLIWCSLLGVIGYLFGSNQESIRKYYKEITIVLLISGSIILFFLFFRKRNNIKK